MEDPNKSCPACAQGDKTATCPCTGTGCAGKIIWLAVIAFIIFIVYMIGKSDNTAMPKLEEKEVSVLLFCPEDSGASQIAQGILKNMNPKLNVVAASKDSKVNPQAIKAMQKDGVDISKDAPKNINELTNQNWDFVVTVCEAANAQCPPFNGKVGKMVHIPLVNNPKVQADMAKTEAEFDKLKTEVKEKFKEFYDKEIVPVIEDMNKMD